MPLKHLFMVINGLYVCQEDISNTITLASLACTVYTKQDISMVLAPKSDPSITWICSVESGLNWLDIYSTLQHFSFHVPLETYFLVFLSDIYFQTCCLALLGKTQQGMCAQMTFCTPLLNLDFTVACLFACTVPSFTFTCCNPQAVFI